MRADDDEKMKSGGSEIPNCKTTRRTLMAGFELQGAAKNHKSFFSRQSKNNIMQHNSY
jgi:hypothetical protein